MKFIPSPRLLIQSPSNFREVISLSCKFDAVQGHTHPCDHNSTAQANTVNGTALRYVKQKKTIMLLGQTEMKVNIQRLLASSTDSTCASDEAVGAPEATPTSQHRSGE